MKNIAQKIFLLFLLVLNFSLVYPQNTEFAELSLTLTASDEKAVLNNLTVQNIEVYVENKRAEIEVFAQKDEPVSIGFLIDTSASMRDVRAVNLNRMIFGVDSFSRFFGNANLENDYFVMTFDKIVKVVSDTTQNQETVKKAIAEISKNKINVEKTEFYEAVKLAFEKIGKSKNATKVLILITDGQNNGNSKIDLEDIKKLLKRENVLLYAIRTLPKNSQRFPMETLTLLQSVDLFERDFKKIRFIAEPFPTQAPRLPADSVEDLDELVSITGGRVFYPINQKEVDDSFNLLADELKNQYDLKIKTTKDFKKNDFNEIKVKFKGQKDKKVGKITVRTRKGFYL